MTTPIHPVGTRVKLLSGSSSLYSQPGTIVAWKVTRLDPEAPWYTVQLDDGSHPEQWPTHMLGVIA